MLTPVAFVVIGLARDPAAQSHTKKKKKNKKLILIWWTEDGAALATRIKYALHVNIALRW